MAEHEDTMTLSDGARRELALERGRLVAEREKRKRDMKRLTDEVSQLNDTIRHIGELLRLGGSPDDKPDSQSPDEADRPFTELGFRDAIRQVLSAAQPRGMKPKEVTEELESRGWSSDESPTTPLNTRVANDLWRMEKSGQLRKRGGRYRLVEKQQPEGEEE